MTDTSFPTHEGYALPCLISAAFAVGAVVFAMIVILTVTSGAAVPSEWPPPALPSTPPKQWGAAARCRRSGSSTDAGTPATREHRPGSDPDQ